MRKHLIDFVAVVGGFYEKKVLYETWKSSAS
jgi:hypothetical protein